MKFLRMLLRPIQTYQLLLRVGWFHTADDIFRIADETRLLLTGKTDR